MGLKGILGSLPPGLRRLVLWLALMQLALIAVHLLAFEAAASALDPKADRKLWDFNQEGSIQTFWSAAVMVAAGLGVLYAGVRRHERQARVIAWLVLGAGFVWLGGEELIHLHEDAQVSSGVDWPLIYVPALAVGIWAIVRVARELEAPFDRVLVVALGCLVAAVATELLSSPAIALDYDVRNLVEENLELAGATLVLLAGLGGAQPPHRVGTALLFAVNPRQ